MPDLAAVITDLLASAEADNLVLLTGAGLSLSPPSTVPSAYGLALQVAAKHETNTGTPLPPGVAGDVEKTADWFLARGQLRPVFIRELVDWGPF